MEIVIKIDEKIYKEALEGGYSHQYDEVVANAVSNAMPLPKGHGRIIDVDAVFENADKVLYENEYVPCVDVDDFRTAPTIIGGIQ